MAGFEVLKMQLKAEGKTDLLRTWFERVLVFFSVFGNRDSILLLIVQVMQNDEIGKWQEVIEILKCIRWKCKDLPMVICGWADWFWHDSRAFAFPVSLQDETHTYDWTVDNDGKKSSFFHLFQSEFSKMERRRKLIWVTGN